MICREALSPIAMPNDCIRSRMTWRRPSRIGAASPSSSTCWQALTLRLRPRGLGRRTTVRCCWCRRLTRCPVPRARCQRCRRPARRRPVRCQRPRCRCCLVGATGVCLPSVAAWCPVMGWWCRLPLPLQPGLRLEWRHPVSVPLWAWSEPPRLG